jgi:hypothetical protein
VSGPGALVEIAPPSPNRSDVTPESIEQDPESNVVAESAQANVDAALADMAEANPSPVTPDPDEAPDPDPPVYDERGNVRPRGTPGAKPMTKAERIKIAKRLADGDRIVTTSERPRKS